MSPALHSIPPNTDEPSFRVPTCEAGRDSDPRPASPFFASADARTAGGRTGGRTSNPRASGPSLRPVAWHPELTRFAVSRAPDGAPLFVVPLHALGDTHA